MTISGKAGRSTRQDMPNCLPAKAVFQEFPLHGFLVGDYIRGLDIPSVVSPGADGIHFTDPPITYEYNNLMPSKPMIDLSGVVFSCKNIHTH